LRKKFIKSLFIFFVICFVLILAQALWFFYVFNRNGQITKADLIAVFAGGDGRIKAGYELSHAGYAPCLMISPATPEKIASYNSKNGHPAPGQLLMEERARTTFENAVFTKQLIENHGFKSIMLVTSFFHQPRSYFLLRSQLIGMDIDIRMHHVSWRGLDRTNWLKSKEGLQIIYDEMIKFWASCLELVYYKLSGRLPEQSPKDIPFLKKLKFALLFHK
jgi:uncharacterized SAM-binding protein YcdF (DUF218 family)